MTTDRTLGTVPVHDQIADDLRAQIAAGDLKPGEALPSVRKLQDQWHCSDRTVREALGVLLGEGRITAGRGAPAKVRVPPERRIAISLTAESAQTQKDLALRPESERASTGAAELSLGVPISETDFNAEYERVSADEDLAKEFGLEVGTELLKRTYSTVSRETGHLVLSSISYVPVSIIEGNRELFDSGNEPWPGGHWHQLHTVNVEIDRLDNSLVAIQPTTRQRQDWGIDPGVALLCLRSRSVDTLGRIVEIADSTYPADRTAVRYTQQLRRWGDST